MWSFFSRDPTKDFPYEVGDKVSGVDDKLLWSLHEGKRKGNGESVSIFAFDLKANSEAMVQVARAAFKRIKTLRHPNILTYIDGLETDRILYVVTESVVPLAIYLENNDLQPESNQLAISWGLHQISKALWFLNNDCSLIHNNVCPASVFVDRAGEWKLGGVEYMYPASGAESIPPIKLLPALEKYEPPERSPGAGKRPSEKWSVDSWGLGCLIWEVFNGSFSKSTSLKAPGKIPKSLIPNYCELAGANPKSRPSSQKFLENCRSSGGFMDNKFVSTMLFLEEIQFQDGEAKNQFFNSLPAALDMFPPSFCKLKILPQLINAFEYGNAGSAVLAPLFKIGKQLEGDEYQKKIVPCVVKLFSSSDRATRVKLLQQIEMFCEHLSPAVVNDQIFPNIAHGFMDSNPVVREQTIKSIVHLAPKLNYKNLNEEVLKHFARLQSRDEQGGIRTNTTVCLGKIACYLSPQVRQRILSSAYMRALKDPFPPARQAGILAMAATHGYFTLADSAQRILPSLCLLTVDPDKGVRDQTFRAIKCFLGKLEKVSENPELAADAEKDVNSGGALPGASAGWTNWAVSGMTSLTSKIYKSRTDRRRSTEDGPESATASPAKPASSARPEVSSPTNAGVASKNKSQPSKSSSTAAVTDVTAATSEDQTATGDGWDDDSWDDEENWGDMETESGTQSAVASRPDASKGADSSRLSSVATTAAAGRGWNDDDDDDDDDVGDSGQGWEDFDAMDTRPTSASKLTSKVAAPKTKLASSGTPTHFTPSEFEQVKDPSLSSTSGYNWDSTPATTTAAAGLGGGAHSGSVGDPNADAFFNSLLEDDKKKTSRSSILKPSSAKPLSATAAKTVNEVPSESKFPQQTSQSQGVAKTPTNDAPKKINKPTTKKATDGWDDEDWSKQW